MHCFPTPTTRLALFADVPVQAARAASVDMASAGGAVDRLGTANVHSTDRTEQDATRYAGIGFQLGTTFAQ